MIEGRVHQKNLYFLINMLYSVDTLDVLKMIFLDILHNMIQGWNK